VPDGFWIAAFADGHIEAMSEAFDSKALRTMFTIAGGEPPVSWPTPTVPHTSGQGLPATLPLLSKPAAGAGSILLKRDANGEVAIYWNNIAVDDEKLRKQLNELKAMFAARDHEVSISAEKDVPMNAVIHVMDLLKDAGITKVTSPILHSNGGAKLEIHRAEQESAEGLKEAEVPGRNEKVYLHPEIEINGDDVQGAGVTTDSNGKPVISVAFTAEGSRKMAVLSKSHLKKPLAIMLDGRVVMAPTVQSEMAGGVLITGNLTQEAAQRIADGLNGK
jgi:biopolymer transport protein ExbD